MRLISGFMGAQKLARRALKDVGWRNTPKQTALNMITWHRARSAVACPLPYTKGRINCSEYTHRAVNRYGVLGLLMGFIYLTFICRVCDWE